MRIWAGFVLFVIVCTFACKQPEQEFSYPVYKSDDGPIVTLYRPYAYEIQFWNGSLEKEFALLVPFTSAKGDAIPESVFDRVTKLNDSARHIAVRDTWYVIHLRNFTSYTKWAMSIDNPGLNPAVFLWQGRSESFIGKLNGEDRYSGYFHEPVRTLYTFDMASLEEAKILIKLSTKEPVELTKVHFYTYKESKYVPVKMPVELSVARAVGIAIILLMLGVFFYSGDWAIVSFLFYFGAFLAPWILWYGPEELADSIWIFEVINFISVSSMIVLAFQLVFDRIDEKKALYAVSAGFLVLLLALLFGAKVFSRHDVAVQLWAELFADLLLLACFCYFRRNQISLKLTVLVTIAVLSDAGYVVNAMLGDVIIYPFYLVVGLLSICIFIFLLLQRLQRFIVGKRKIMVAAKIEAQRLVSSAVIHSLEDERKRIAQDIHDELGSTLALIKIKLSSDNKDSKDATELRSLISRASSSARSIAYQLMPPYFAETDLKMLLFSHFNTLNERGDIKFDFNYSNGHNAFTKDEELMIYRIVLELTNNCVKHSGATRATVSLAFGEKELVMEFTDNGKGIGESASSGIGMQSIQSRVSYLNGTIERESAHPGCKFMIRIPYHELGQTLAE
ncbi:MAG: hypothetical protein KGO82_14820 [Bacteroidota bacterium]|nr:hypothetical protein [Bacteroidota bacterium]